MHLSLENRAAIESPVVNTSTLVSYEVLLVSTYPYHSGNSGREAHGLSHLNTPAGLACKTVYGQYLSHDLAPVVNATHGALSMLWFYYNSNLFRVSS